MWWSKKLEVTIGKLQVDALVEGSYVGLRCAERRIWGREGSVRDGMRGSMGRVGGLAYVV
jgi:hypothetical protein